MTAVPGGPHDAPTAAQLVEAVREWLESEVFPAVEGRLQFHTRVAVNVLGMVERELELGPRQADAHARRLETLGVADDCELAEAIRRGAFDDRTEELRAALWEAVHDKLAVANPGYAGEPSDGG